MAKFPKPYFRSQRGTWCLQLHGKQITLGPEEKEAFRLYHQLMADPLLLKQPDTNAPAVITVLDAYLDWLENRVRDGSKAQRTYDWYQAYLQDFSRFHTDAYRIQDLTIAQLELIHLYQWADAHAGWKTGKRGAIMAVQRAFNWAARAGLLKSVGGKSPLAHLEKPPQGRREQLISPAEYQETLALVNDQEFRDLVEHAWETGCRPHELFTVQAAYVHLPTGKWTFPIRLSKGRRVQRVVYLSDRALEITRRLVVKRLTGPLLLNTDGQPWCVSSVKCRFQVICRVLGRRRLGGSRSYLPESPASRLSGAAIPRFERNMRRKFLSAGAS